MKVTRKILTIAIGIILFAAGGFMFAQSGFITNYFSDRDNIRFLYDTRSQYVLGQSMPVDIQVFDVNTNQKPQGISVVMNVDGVSRGVIVPGSSTQREYTVDIGSLGLGVGTHTITFTSPNACGNFFDFSRFGATTRFDYTTDCVFEKTVTVTGVVVGTSGCTDAAALNYNASATSDDGSCRYTGTLTESTFLCSQNRSVWVECEGRTFVLQRVTDPIYVRAEPGFAGAWSDWCSGEIGNGAQATFTELTSNGSDARVNFTFANPGQMFDMQLCLNPDDDTAADSSKNIKLRLFDIKFIES